MLKEYPAADPLKIRSCVTGIRMVDKVPKLGEDWEDLLGPLFDKQERKRRTRQLQKYRARLLAVKRYRPHWWGMREFIFRSRLDEEGKCVREAFLTALGEEVKRVNEVIGPGKKPRDMVAWAAAGYAGGLLPRELWTLTNDGPYHKYCMLLYEAATGIEDSGKLLRYMKPMMPVLICNPPQRTQR